MQSIEMKPVQEKVRPLWLNRDYMLLWSGQVISSIGSQVSQLAFPLLILALTHSPVQAGIAGALRALPYLIFSLPAGALIDRWDRKRVMIICDSGRMLAMISIPLAFLLGHISIMQIYIVSTIEGTLFVFFNIAEAACLPRVVPKSQLAAATAQNQSMDGITSLIGPSLGGALYVISSVVPFMADACSYLISVIALFFIKSQFQGQRSVAPRRLWVEIWEGLHWLWKQPLIRIMAILTGGNNLCSAGSALIIIVLAQSMHASSVLIGLILGLSGIGGIVGAIIAPSIHKRFSFGQVIITTMWIAASTLGCYLLAFNIVLLGLISVMLFISGPIYNVVQFSYRSALIPDELQGRVNSVFRLIAFGGQPIGLAATGWLLQEVGAAQTIFYFTLISILLAVVATINPHIRHAQPLKN